MSNTLPWITIESWVASFSNTCFRFELNNKKSLSNDENLSMFLKWHTNHFFLDSNLAGFYTLDHSKFKSSTFKIASGFSTKSPLCYS